MHKKYLKNRYQIMCFLLSMSLFVFLSIFALFEGVSKSITLLIALIPVVFILLCSILGFYIVFQFVSFDEIGIHIYLLKKEIKIINWVDVVEIQESYIYRGPIYSIKCKDGKELNLDRRKELKEEIDKYFRQD